MGSELYAGDQRIWPGPVGSLVFRYPYMKELLDPDLRVGDIIRRVAIHGQYDDIVDELKSCGYAEAEENRQRTLWIVPYDWRKDNALAAELLASAIDKATEAHGKDVSIAIVAHSMGGLVARYYLESNKFTARAGYKRVVMLVTLATPHRGAPLALLAARGQIRRLFLNEEQVKELANRAEFPSLYQLLPPRGEPFAWDRNPDALFEPMDVYDDSIGQGLGLNPEIVQIARTFHAALDLSQKPAGVRYFAFSGTRQETATAVWITRFDEGPWHVVAHDMEDAGDETVPIWSSAVTGLQNEPTGGSHGTIFKSHSLKRTLRRLLGAPITLAGPAPVAELAVRDPVVTPGALERVALSFPSGVGQLRADIRVQLQWEQSGLFATPSVVVPLSLSGAAEAMNVGFRAPDRPGVYRVGLFAAENTDDVPLASDAMFVQMDAEAPKPNDEA